MRPIWLVGLLLFLSLQVLAQDRPKVEVFGGFSYTDVRPSQGRIMAKGWHAMVAVNSRQNWFEFVADFSGHYGSLGGAPTNTHVAMAGIRFSLQRGRLMAFVHSMYGVSMGRPPLIELEDVYANQRVWFTYVPGGGGMDIVLHRRLALRVIQFDLIFHSRTPDYLQGYPQTDQSGTIQPRVSGGIVLRIGKV